MKTRQFFVGGLFAVLFALIFVACGGGAGGGGDPGGTFVAVTNITGVPDEATVGTPLTLTGTVVPSNATNRTIVWSVVEAGTTGTSISGTSLSATATGADPVVTVRATIANGKAQGTAYTQNFNITVVKGYGTQDDPYELTEDVWTDGEITTETENGEVWYTFEVDENTTYRVWWNESGSYGNGIKTLDVEVSGYYSDGTTTTPIASFSESDTAWTTAKSFTPNASQAGTVLLKVAPYSMGSIGTFAIVYSTDTDKPVAPFTPPNPIPLTANQWKDGEITSATASSGVWYTFDVTEEETCSVWWNESDPYGNGFKTLNIQVSGYYSDGTLISNFNNVTTAWSTAQSFESTESGTVYLKVTPYSADGTGTFGIVYNTSGTKPVAPFTPPNPIPLTANQWKDGYIGVSGQVVWYSFNVSAGTTYRVWWNESGGFDGDGSKSLDIEVTGYYNDGTSSFAKADSAWGTAKSFTPTSNGTVYLKVEAWSSSNTGTFGIVYSTGTTRPAVPAFNPPATQLAADTWKDGVIASGQTEVWYKVTVTAATPYYFWWNEAGSSYGNRTKTLDVSVSAHTSSGAIISGFSNQDSAWSSSKSYTPTTGGTVYLVVRSRTGNTGAFGIVYSAANERPPVPINAVSPTELTDNEWKKGEIITASNGELWYSFDVTGGETYRVWWNESGANGNGLFRTLDVSASAWYASTGENIYYNIENGWSNAQTITVPAAPATDTVYIRVYPKTAGQTGSFDIVYSSTVTSRPDVPFWPGEPPNPVPLTAAVWKDGEINASTQPSGAWYSFDVTVGTTYYVWWNETGSNGSGNKTLNVRVNGYYSTGAVIFNNQETAWGTARNFTPASDGTVYLRVTPSSSGQTGTFGIAYKTTNTRPLVLPSNITALTAAIWKDGEITASTPLGELWYSFPVSSGTYNVWWNEPAANGNDSKTLNVKVSGYYSDGTVIFTEQDTAWATARNFTAASDDTVYLKVTPYTSGQIGTFGIVHSTANTRPLVPINPVNVIHLANSGEWADGSITSQNREIWYSFNTSSTAYNNVLWNEAGSNNGKTMDVKVSAYYEDGTIISIAVDTPGLQQFLTPTSKLVYLKVTPSASAATANGTFGIVYYLGSTPPTVPIPPPANAIALANGVWQNSAITESGGEIWYSVEVPYNTTYYVWWNDSKAGNGAASLDIKVNAYVRTSPAQTNLGSLTSVNESASILYGDSAWNASKSINSGTYVVTIFFVVTALTPGNTGTFNFVYTSLNSKPDLPFTPPSPTALAEAQWKNGNLTSNGQEWFSFTATESPQYIHIAFGTLDDLQVQIYDGSGAAVGTEVNMWSSTRSTSQTLTVGESYYIRVRPYQTKSGNYRIAFNTSNTAPAQ